MTIEPVAVSCRTRRSMCRVFKKDTLAASLVLALLPLPAVAMPGGGNEIPGEASPQPDAPAEQAASKDKTTTLDGLTVSAPKAKFIDLEAKGATKLPLPIDKIPQSVSMISKEFLDSASISNVGELAEYVPGLSQDGKSFGFGSRLKARGFSMESLYSYKINGYMHGFFFDLDDALLDHMEVIRGPSSATYGIGAPGGLINYVLKDAPYKNQGQFQLGVGSWNTLDASAAYGGPLNESGTLRGYGVVSSSTTDGFINEMDDVKTSVGGILDWSATDKLDFKLLAYSTRDNGNTNDGVPLFSDASFPKVSRSLFLGGSDNKGDFKGNLFNLEGVYHADDGSDYGVDLAYEDSNSDYITAYPFSIESEGTVEMSKLARKIDSKMVNAAAYWQKGFDLFGVSGSMVRAEMSYYKLKYTTVSNHSAYNASGNTTTSVNLYTMTQQEILDALAAFQFQGAWRTTWLESSAKIASLQGVLKPHEKFSVIGGVTLNDPTVATNSTKYDYDTQRSYRVGAIYEPMENVNIYASWSDSFLPQTRRDQNNNPIAPLEGEQYEVGTKVKFFDGKLLATLAAYQITQKNQAALIAGSNPEAYRTLGEVEHKGVELEITGQIKDGWNVYATMAHLNAKVTASTDADEIGRRRPFIPDKTSSLFTTYDIPLHDATALRLGGGGRYVSSSPISTADANPVMFPGHTVWDLTSAYVTSGYQIRLNINNVFDKNYRLASWDSIEYGVYPGEPRSWQIQFVKNL